MKARAGFTLIEVLAVSALISVVFLVALNFYTDLSRASARASDYTRDVRRATAVLDRIARDFEGAFLVVKPPEVDPISHPWLFIGEGQIAGDGADHVKFVTRNHYPGRTDAPESDLAMVAYVVERDADDRLALYRWSLPHLPESLDRSYPLPDDEGSYLMADDLGSFAIRFLTEDGETVNDWDSTTILESSSLPAGVEIEVSMARDDEDSTDDFDDGDPTGDDDGRYVRRVLIQVRPLDLAALLSPEGAGGPGEGESEDGEGESGDGLTVGQCVDTSTLSDVPSECAALLSLVASQPSLAFDRGDVAGLPPSCQALVSPECR